MSIAKLSLISLSLLWLVPGCASDNAQTTPKQEAIKGWNDARAAVMLNLARDQYTQGHFDKSRDTVNQAMSLAPDNAVAHVLSGKLYIEAGQLEAAEKELDSARQFDLKNAEADYLSGVVYQRWQQPAKALECYEHACDKAPAELSYLMAKAEMLVAMNQRDEAITLLQSKMNYFEHSAVIRDEVGLLLIQKGRPVEAVEMFRQASILATDDLTIREHLATGLYYSKKYQQCADALFTLVKEPRYQQRADLLMMLGECQFETGRAGDALANFQTASDLMPSLPGIWLSLAKAQLQLDELKPADISLHRDLAQNPNNAESQVLLGYLRLKQSRDADALGAFELANQLSPGDSTSLCMIGYTLEKLGRHQEAVNYYKLALKINPSDDLASQLMAGVDVNE